MNIRPYNIFKCIQTYMLGIYIIIGIAMMFVNFVRFVWLRTVSLVESTI